MFLNFFHFKNKKLISGRFNNKEGICRGFNKRGFSIIEMIIGVAVFAMIAISVYGAFSTVVGLVNVSKMKVTAISLANEQFELIRNLSYDDVGLKNGVPVGILDHTRTITRNGVPFTLTTTIRNIDDPYDGVIGGTPNDSSPADYKMVEVEVACQSCKNFTPIIITSIVSPKNLETTSTNGALFVQVFDANGLPVSSADVSIRNDEFVPAIIIDEVTDQNGRFQLVDAPPAVQSYNVSVSKPGYSSEQTYPPGDASNPNPTKPDATVAVGQVTQVSFAIDKLSSLNLSTVNEMCAPIPNVDFDLIGSKLIGQAPDVLKFKDSFSTDNSGVKNITDLEWDTYFLDITDGAYDLLGVNPEFPLSLLPNETKNVQAVVAPNSPNSLIVNVKDGATRLPLSGVVVTLSNDSGLNIVQNTGRGFAVQNSWIGGSGQELFTDETKYFSGSQIDNSAELIRLGQNGSEFFQSGELISSTFDVGSPSNFYDINWLPENQPAGVGVDSVKFQVAANNDGLTWNFSGPDGTDQSFYTLGNTNLNSIYNGNQFLRYKLFLNTASTSFTPSVSEIAFTFSSDCVSPGQTRFSSLGDGTYHLLLEKTGYQPDELDIDVSSSSVYYESSLNAL